MSKKDDSLAIGALLTHDDGEGGDPLDLRDPYNIAITGVKGSGKTLFMSWLACHAMVFHQMPCFSNYRIAFDLKIKGKKYHFESQELDLFGVYDIRSGIKRAFVAFDEIQFFADARASISTKNRLITYFQNQSRKRQITICYTTQFFEWIDKRLQQATDVLIKCQDASRTSGGRESHMRRGEVFDITAYDLSGQWTGATVSQTHAPAARYSFFGKPMWSVYDTSFMVDAIEAGRNVRLDTAPIVIGDHVDERQKSEEMVLVMAQVLRSEGVTEISTKDFYDYLRSNNVDVNNNTVGKVLNANGAQTRQKSRGHVFDLSNLMEAR